MSSFSIHSCLALWWHSRIEDTVPFVNRLFPVRKESGGLADLDVHPTMGLRHVSWLK